MPLILAIEPDRRQASQLTAIVRGRLHAELVLADSAERALAALGDRVPDLVLTSALLSPRDETALSDRLRALDGHAVHVQTLTIPVLASHSSHGGGRASGMLSALRRDRSRGGGHDGCDPAVFAEQCKEYLERAATERDIFLERSVPITVAEPVRPVTPSPVTGSEWVVVRDDEPPIQASSTQDMEVEASSTSEAEIEPVVEAPTLESTAEPYEPDQPIGEPFERPAAQPVDIPRMDEPPAPELIVPAAARSEEVTDAPRVDRVLREFLDLTSSDNDGPASLLAAVAALTAEEQHDVTPATERTIEAPADEPASRLDGSDTRAEVETGPALAPNESIGVSELDLSSLLADLSSQPSGASDSFVNDLQADVYEIDTDSLNDSIELIAQAPASDARTGLATLTDLEDIFKSAPEFRPPATAAQPAAAPAAETVDRPKEWGDILEALKRDAEQLDARRATTTGEDRADSLTPPEPLELSSLLAEPALPAAPAVEVQTTVSQVSVAPVPTDQPAPDSPPADAAPAPAPADPQAGKRKRKRAKAPAQDEWGFFDPDQCGFAALIEKLEEITEDDTPTPRGA